MLLAEDALSQLRTCSCWCLSEPWGHQLFLLSVTLAKLGYHRNKMSQRHLPTWWSHRHIFKCFDFDFLLFCGYKILHRTISTSNHVIWTNQIEGMITHLTQNQNHSLSYSLKEVWVEELDKDTKCQPLTCSCIVAQAYLHIWRSGGEFSDFFFGLALRGPHSWQAQGRTDKKSW